jgi:mannose-6-phosphate isomerase-like protein (cupin superfamily)
MMMVRPALTFAIFALLAVPAPARGGAHILQHSHCVVAGGLAHPVDWDVWQEIYQPAYPIWLTPHTHRGAECVMTVTGVASWWYENGGPEPSPAARIVRVPAGKPLYTEQGRVHDAGNETRRTMAYMGIHVLETGTQFNYPVTDPAPKATPMPGATEIKHFKTDFPQQPHLGGTFTIDNRIEELPQGAAYSRRASQSLVYYSVVRGRALVTIGSVPARMAENTSVAIPRGAVATIASEAAHTVLAVTVLLPGDCDATPHACDFP